MKNAKTLLAILPLATIAAIAIGVGMSSNVLALPNTPTAVDHQDSSNTADQKDSPNDVTDSQTKTSGTADTGADDHQDGEVNDDHSSAKGPNGDDGDGEQKDSTELKK